MARRRIIRELPPTTRGRGREAYEWDKAALDAKKQYDEDPKLWVLAGEAVPQSQINALRQYSVQPFVTDDGRIEVAMRNSFKGDDGKRYGDCWVHWVPKKKEAASGTTPSGN